MSRGQITTTGILNAIGPLLRGVAAPAAGILLLTALPLRILQLQFIDLLMRLRNAATHYGNLLTAICILIVVAFVLSLYGRAVFMQACRDRPARWRELLRVDASTFLSFIYVSLLLELAMVLFCVAVIPIPLVILLAGVVAAALPDRLPPAPLAPLRALTPYLMNGRVLTGVLFVFAVGFGVAAVNLVFLARLLVWAAQAIPGFDPVLWGVATQGGSSRFDLAVLALAATVVEPFWLTAMYVYGDRVRSRQSGDDLRKRFADITRLPAMTATAAIVISLAIAPSVHGVTITTYVQQLQTIHDDLEGRRFDLAAAHARELAASGQVTSGTTTFHPDRSLLNAVEQSAAKSQIDIGLMRRLDVTIEALQSAGGQPGPVRSTDAALLERVRAREKAGELWRGGEVEVPAGNETVFGEVTKIIQKTIDWLVKWLERVYDWLRGLIPHREKKEEREFLGISFVVWAVTLLVAAVIVFLAVYVLRRTRRRAAATLSEEPEASARDADPLSRESNEWEHYAAELASAGKFREAIRAWYHAVLMTLYRAGIFHYRKGVTNWEYVRDLSPETLWRPRFITITRQFEREWYGHHEASATALDDCAAEARAILAAVRRENR